MSFDLLTDGWVIISSIQTQVLRLRLGWLGAGDDQAIHRRVQQFHVMTIGSLNDQSQGNPRTISQETAFDSPLAAIGGIGSGRGARKPDK